MLEKILFDKYSEYGKISLSGEIYLPIKISKMFIAECNKLNVAIVGVEFFHKKGEYIIPVNPINSIDCSSIIENFSEWKDVVNNCTKAVTVVLDLEIKRDDTQYFNPSLLEEYEWK